MQIKRIDLIFAGLVMAMALWTGCSQADNSLGKSMGRWEDFSLESMIQNRQGGLEYIEVTMNTVIGKDTAGVRDRAAALKADIDSAGLKVWSVHMPYSRKIDISLADSAKRADVVNYMADMMKVAGVFQPQRIVLHPSSEPIAPDERAERLRNSHESIGLLAPVAKEIGAELCIENLPRTCLGKNGQEMMYLTVSISLISNSCSKGTGPPLEVQSRIQAGNSRAGAARAQARLMRARLR